MVKMRFLSFIGIETRTRCDVVLEILVNDMKRMVEKFSLSLMANVSNSSNNETNSQQLKDVQERWKQSNRRGHGHYAKVPETSTMNNLKNALITSLASINDGLIMPQLSAPHWLNLSIGLLLSIKCIRETPAPSLLNKPLLIDTLSFVNSWTSACKRLQPPKKTSIELNKLLNTQFNIPINVPSDVNGQLSFIIFNMLLEILPCSMSMKKTYHCTSCNYTITIQSDIKYIEISMVENQFRFNQQLANYFASNSSDHLCNKCNMPMSRQIKVSDCKYI